MQYPQQTVVVAFRDLQRSHSRSRRKSVAGALGYPPVRDGHRAVRREQLERGLRILHAYEKVPQHNLENKDSLLQQIIEIIREYDGGQSEQWEMPF